MSEASEMTPSLCKAGAMFFVDPPVLPKPTPYPLFTRGGKNILWG